VAICRKQDNEPPGTRKGGGFLGLAEELWVSEGRLPDPWS